MPMIPLLNAPSVAPTTTAGQRFSAPATLDAAIVNGARFNTSPQEIKPADMRGSLGETMRLQDQANQASGRLNALFERKQKEAQDQADRARVNEAIDSAVQARLHMTYDQDTGYTNLHGKAALDRPDKQSLESEYGGQYDQTLMELASTLGNDNQRAMFLEKAGQLATSFRGDLMQHAARENTKYQLGVQDGVIKTAVGRMGLEFDKPDQLKSAMEDIRGATYEAGKIAGLSGEQIQANIVENLSAGHASVIGTALQRDMAEYAEEYFKQHKDELTPEARLSLGKTVEEGSRLTRIQADSDKLWDKYGLDTKGAMDEIRSKYEGKDRKEMETRFLEQTSRERAIKKQEQDDAFSVVFTKVQAGQRVTAVELNSLDPRDRATIDSYRRARASEAATKTNMAAWLTFMDIPKAELAKMTGADLARRFGKDFSTTDLKSAMNDIQAAKDYVEKKDTTGLQVFSVQDSIKGAARDLGIIPKNPGAKLSADEEAALFDFKQKTQGMVEVWERANGRKAKPDDLVQIMADAKLDTVRLRSSVGKWFDSEPQALISVSPEDMGRAYVVVKGPDGGAVEVGLASIDRKVRARIEQKLLDNKMPVTERNIAQLWVQIGKPKN